MSFQGWLVVLVVGWLIMSGRVDLAALTPTAFDGGGRVCNQRGTLTTGQLRAAARRGGFRGYDVNTAVAVAKAESSGRATVAGDGGNSHGLWQIHAPSHPQYSRRELVNPCVNARAAKRISSSGRGWANWTTYRTGAYRRWLR